MHAVDKVTFAVDEREVVGLVGESGCGKSTLGRIACGLYEPTEGAVRYRGQPIHHMNGAQRPVQMIFQDPFASLNPRMTAGDMLAEPLMLHETVPHSGRRARVAELLSLVGLRPESAGRYPHEFSGGQRQRLAIARALAAEPRVIVCDEPVSALDVSIQAQILNLLADLQRRFGLAYVFISHDLSVVRQVADSVAVMYLGRFVESGPAQRVFEGPRHPYTRALLAAVPVPVPGARTRDNVVGGDVPSPLAPPPGCHFHTRCPHAVERCRTEVPALEEVDEDGAVACHRWREIDAVAGAAARRPPHNPALARLQAAFAERGAG